MSKTDEPLEPTIDWLIDEIAPNEGMSPLIDWNKQRLRDLIKAHTEKAVIEGKLEELKKARNWIKNDAYPIDRIEREISKLEGDDDE